MKGVVSGVYPGDTPRAGSIHKRRKGSTLVELLAAIPLISLIGLIATLLVLDAQQLVRKAEGRASRNRELRYASWVLTGVIRNAHGSDLHSWSDTLIDLGMEVGTAVVCSQPSPGVIDLLAGDGEGVVRPGWMSVPDPGDMITVATEPTTVTGAPSVRTAILEAVSRSVAGCDNPLLAPLNVGKVWRFHLSDLTGDVIGGSFVRVTRRTRFSLYRGGDGGWYLGVRSMRATGWEAVQPIAGPFAAAAQGGLRFEVIERDEQLRGVTSPDTGQSSHSIRVPIAVRVSLKAIAPWKNRDGTRDSDSLSTVIALRNR